MKKINKIFLSFAGMATVTASAIPTASCISKPLDFSLSFKVKDEGTMSSNKRGYIELSWTPFTKEMIFSNLTFKYGAGIDTVVASIEEGTKSTPVTIHLQFDDEITQDITDGQLSFHFKCVGTTYEDDWTIKNIKITKYTQPLCSDLCFNAINGSGPTKISYKTLCELNSSVFPSKLENFELEYSFDGNDWKKWTCDSEQYISSEITIDADDDDPLNNQVFIHNKNSQLSYQTTQQEGSDTYHYMHYLNFVTDGGSVNVSGNINSMVNYQPLSSYCFTRLFAGCNSIVKIDKDLLPATDLQPFCYYGMFENCQGLTHISNNLLPAQKLSSGCYRGLFYHCENLAQIPEELLPATELKSSCYEGMFEGCKSLTSIPEGLLPAPTLQTNCYCYMFRDCTGISSLPQHLLPAMELNGLCYEGMFKGCTSLKTLPTDFLPATDLSTACYAEMFTGCKSIINIPKGFMKAEWMDSECCLYMFADCISLTSIPDDLLETDVDSFYLKHKCYFGMFEGCLSLKIYEGETNEGIKFWTCPYTSTLDPFSRMFTSTGGPYNGTPKSGKSYYYALPPLYFEDINPDGDSTVGYTIHGSLPNIQIQTSEDSVNWQDWNGDEKTISDGQKLYVRNAKNGLSANSTNYLRFNMKHGAIKVSGNVNSMNNYQPLSDYCYFGLFEDCSCLVNIDDFRLPSTTLANYCYYDMFSGCSKLSSIPHDFLPATTLSNYCYADMFYNCDSLTELPEGFLPATNLAEDCYSEMFDFCDNLYKLPKNLLPATQLQKWCYSRMFNNCTSLKIANNDSFGGVAFFTYPELDAYEATKDMFKATGGTYTDDPVVNTTYYCY